MIHLKYRNPHHSSVLNMPSIMSIRVANPVDSRGWGAGRTQIWNWKIYVPHRVYNGGFRERPLTENRGLSERPLTGKQGILELRITKKRIFFLKTRVFSIWPGRESGTKNCKSLKRGSFGAAQVEKWREGFSAEHTRTVLIIMGVPPTPPHPRRRGWLSGWKFCNPKHITRQTATSASVLS